MSAEVAVICNPSAGGGRALERLPAVTAELGRLGLAHRVVHTRDIAHAREEAQAAGQASETVVAVGGDGLLRPLAAALRDTESILAIVPGGRGNDLARVLGIPADDPAAAVRLITEGEERLIDVAEVDGEPFLGIASFGFDSDANRIANELRLIRGNAVYVVAALRALIAWKPASFVVTVDGAERNVTGYTVAVGNSKAYGGGMYITPHAELDDGKLDVVTIGRSPKLRFLLSLPKVFSGQHLADRSVLSTRGEVVEVAADRPFEIYADGDPIGSLPARITVRKRCLRVVVPR